MITKTGNLKTQYKYIIFDFDGTINNTEPGITSTFKKVLDHYGVDYSKVDFNKHIGPPLEHSFRQLVGDDRWEEAVSLYRKTFEQDNAMLMSKPYDGIKEALQQLKTLGFKLGLATSKYEPYAVKSLQFLGIDHLFDAVYGQNEKRGYKNEILAQLIADNKWDKSLCLMVGDTCFDIDGAKQNDIDVLAVSWGFEARQVLVDRQPNAVVDTVAEMLQLISSLR